MIVDAIIGAVLSVISWLDSLVPALPWPSFLSSSFVSGTVATQIGHFLHPLAPYLPIVLLLTVLSNLLLFWPAVVAYLVFSWIWRHIPDIMGFGTGNAN